MGGVQGSIQKRAKSPGIVFNYTPQKIVSPMTPVYCAQRNILHLNSTLNNVKAPLSHNFPQNNLVNNVFLNTRVNNGFSNQIRRVLSPQNIHLENNAFGP